MKVYALFDKKSGSYFSLACWKNDDLYKRSLYSIVNSPVPENLFATHSTDFELFQLGLLDEKSGLLTPDLRFICSAADLKKEENQ